MMKRPILLLLCMVALSNAAHAPYGFQSGKDESHSYAGGMAYDKTRHLLYITGQTYGEYFLGKALGNMNAEVEESNCFMGVVKLPDHASREMKWLEVQEMGDNTVTEACSALVHAGDDKLYAVGHSEEGGVMTQLRPFGSTRSKVYGTVSQFNVELEGDPDTTAASVSLEGGRLVHPSEGVHYPTALALEPNENTIFVASVNSENKELSKDQPTENLDKPDWTFQQKYGNDYSVIIQRLVPLDPPKPAEEENVDLNETLFEGWGEFLSAKNEDGSDEAVYVTALDHVNRDNLLFAGHTKGYGPAFGADVKSTANDFDGYVTKLKPEDGKLPTERKNYSVRIGSDQDDMIHALCHFENDVYIVGTTNGVLGNDDTQTVTASDAFVMKLGLENLDIQWVKQIGAVPGTHTPAGENPHVQGISCAMTHDGSNIYVAGNVESGGVLSGDGMDGAYSLGGSDVFVAQFAASGDLVWAKQTGTSQNERVAHGGGVVVDANDNAILMGNTNGAMLRNKNVEDEAFTDVFFQSFGIDNGEHMESIDVQRGKHEIIPNEPPPSLNVPAATPVPTATEGTVDGEGTQATVETEASNKDGGGGLSGGAIFGIVAICLGVLLCIFVVRRRMEFNRKQDNSQLLDPVSPYLKDFNYGEVDMKHSATGGWHGIYTNPKLAPEGSRTTNRSYRDELEEINFRSGASASYNDSFVKDSLFMDDLDVPKLGNHDHHSPGSSRVLEKDEEEDEREGSNSSRQLSTYDDLLDAYNTTWDDLNPHKLPSNTSGLSMPGRGGNKRQSEAEGLLDNDDPPGWGTEII